ncbi:MAG: hypothetical protein KME26_08570 [Oscillatoria princeps RMCB-10]|jgi:uncharacterized membrane protein/glutaredoxin|nr:hypothetical protein [Oscillatoria princeps RMCB-10]
MVRRRQTPWIHRFSRLLIAAIAAAGALETAFLTVVELTGSASAVCPTSGCVQVLSSSYGKVFGLPLTLFGFLAYTGMGVLAAAPLTIDPVNKKELRSKLEKQTWPLLFAGGTAMVIFSSYLFYLQAFEIKAFCPYCIASAVFSLSLFVLSLTGREWEDMGQLFFNGVIVGMVTLIGTLGLYASAKAPVATPGATTASSAPGQAGQPITTISGEAEIALARHLRAIGAKEYGAYWCPHCHDQKQLFGKEASEILDYVECDPSGKNARPQLCAEAKIKGYPTWEIKGQLYPGVFSLQKLGELSGYQGPGNFKNLIPGAAAP